MTFEPVRTELLARGAHVLFDSSRIPGRILDVLVVRADAMQSHLRQLKILLASHFAAQDYMARQPQDAAARMARRLEVTPAQVLPQFDGMKLPNVAENWQWLSGDKPGISTAASALASLMLQRRLLQHQVDVSRLADAACLPERR
ncbi:hypothetical protein GALL_310240 [mine drainage metagenome]|uniref:Uncharacterized protein n=1 Tax=mine drainage metagenome TaxID=410659 RepID=A0A1J5QUI0_9ZZZZ